MILDNNNIDSSSIIKLKDIIHIKNKFCESWTCVVQYKQITEWITTDKISYYIGKKGNLINISDAMNIAKENKKEYIEEIENEMLNNEYYANEISINLISSKHKLFFDEVNRILTINTEFFDIAVVEGIHKCCATVEAIKKNIDLCGTFILKIMNLSITSVMGYLRQQANINRVSPDYWEKNNSNNNITKLITKINNYGNEDVNPLYKKIDLDFNTPNTLISFEMFKEGLELSGFMNDIANTDKPQEYNKIEKFIVEFFNALYTAMKNNKINKNRKNVYSDPTFIMGLLITCHRYYKTKNIIAMDNTAVKLKYTSTEFTFDYPISSRRKELLIYNKFYRLIEKADAVKPKNNYIRTNDIYKSGAGKYNENVDNNIKDIILNMNSIENLDATITVYENSILNEKSLNKIKRNNISISDTDNEKRFTNLEVYQLGISGESFVNRLLLEKNKELLNLLGLKNEDIELIDWYNKSFNINDENWEDQSINKGHDIIINAKCKNLYLEIKTSFDNISYFTLTKNESEKNIKAQDDYYVIKINNMKYFNNTLLKPKIRIIKNPLKMAGIYLCEVNNLRDISIYL